MFDLSEATDEVARVVRGVSDAQLGASTPCPDYAVAGMLDHLMALTAAFSAGARKEPVTGDESPPGAAASEHLSPNWRSELPHRLSGLAEAWKDPSAWEGVTEVGGATMPGAVMAVVALDEVVVHGWDLARATGQDYAVNDDDAEIVYQFAHGTTAPEQAALRSGIFGPVIPIADAAPLFDRALGYAGRDPLWKPL